MEDVRDESEESRRDGEDFHESAQDASLLFSDKWRDAVAAIPHSLRLMSEVELQEQLHPGPLDWALRRNYQEIARRALIENPESLEVQAIYTGICARQYFYAQIISNPMRVAWIVRPIVEHTAMYDAIHQAGLQKILAYVRTHELSEKTLGQFMKVIERAGDRVHGAVAQKMQIQSKNVNVEMTGKEAGIVPNDQDTEKRIAELQKNLLEGSRDVTRANIED